MATSGGLLSIAVQTNKSLGRILASFVDVVLTETVLFKVIRFVGPGSIEGLVFADHFIFRASFPGTEPANRFEAELPKSPGSALVLCCGLQSLLVSGSS